MRTSRISLSILLACFLSACASNAGRPGGASGTLLIKEQRSSAVGGTMTAAPDVGIEGSTHFPMSDLNNVQIADRVSKFLAGKRLD